jgi:hypothetical protein
MQQRNDSPAKQSRLRRLKGLAVAGTAGLGVLLWGVVSGTVASATPAATSTPQPISQDTSDDSDFFGATDTAPGLGQTNAQPMTRTGGS